MLWELTSPCHALAPHLDTSPEPCALGPLVGIWVSNPGAVMEVAAFPAVTDGSSGFMVANHPVYVQVACGGAHPAHALQRPWAAGAGSH